MKSMMSETVKECPFRFKTDAKTFKPGDTVCYRAPDVFGEMAFIGELVEVHEQHVVLKHQGEADNEDAFMAATREDYPSVAKVDALKVIGR